MRHPRLTVKQRVWSRVSIPSAVARGVDPWDLCWKYRGAHSRKRDGVRRPHISVQGRMVSVARLVCEWAHGPAPSDEHHAGHTCPTGECASCINPRHLEWQTPLQNLDRRQANKGRKSTSGASNASRHEATRGAAVDVTPEALHTGLRAPSRSPTTASFDAPDPA